METTVKILKNTEAHPRHKLADAEVHFTGGDLDGLKLVGFTIWKRTDGHGLYVTMPARQFTLHGQRRDFMLLRPIEQKEAANRFRRAILDTYETGGEQTDRTANVVDEACADPSGDTEEVSDDRAASAF